MRGGRAARAVDVGVVSSKRRIIPVGVDEYAAEWIAPSG